MLKPVPRTQEAITSMWLGMESLFALLRGGDGAPTLHEELSAREHLRSEEHTSELQSLMRISYAVFCLTNKNKQQHTNHADNKSHTLNQKLPHLHHKYYT